MVLHSNIIGNSTQIPDESHVNLFFHTLPTTITHVTGSVLLPIELSAVRPLAWYKLNFVGLGCLILPILYFFPLRESIFGWVLSPIFLYSYQLGSQRYIWRSLSLYSFAMVFHMGEFL